MRLRAFSVHTTTQEKEDFFYFYFNSRALVFPGLLAMRSSPPYRKCHVLLTRVYAGGKKTCYFLWVRVCVCVDIISVVKPSYTRTKKKKTREKKNSIVCNFIYFWTQGDRTIGKFICYVAAFYNFYFHFELHRFHRAQFYKFWTNRRSPGITRIFAFKCETKKKRCFFFM